MSMTLSVNAFYKYHSWIMPKNDDGFTTFSLHCDESSYIVQGSGEDHYGVFTITGIFDGTNLRFVKQYVNGTHNTAWKCVCHRVDNGTAANFEEGSVQQFVGSWGLGQMSYGEFILSVAKKPEGAALPPADRDASMPPFDDTLFGQLTGELAEEVMREAGRGLPMWMVADLMRGFTATSR